MKKIIVILLLMQITSNNMVAGELIKVPVLLEHYKHHSREHHDVADFFDFLHKHYSGDNNKSTGLNHGDEDNDCNLPFKHCNNCCVGTHQTITCSLPSYELPDLGQVEEVEYKVEDENILSLHVSNIWQPPKIA